MFKKMCLKLNGSRCGVANARVIARVITCDIQLMESISRVMLCDLLGVNTRAQPSKYHDVAQPHNIEIRCWLTWVSLWGSGF